MVQIFMLNKKLDYTPILRLDCLNLAGSLYIMWLPLQEDFFVLQLCMQTVDVLKYFRSSLSQVNLIQSIQLWDNLIESNINGLSHNSVKGKFSASISE